MSLWSNFTNGTIQYAFEAFQAVDPWFYPLFFLGIIGYIYTCMHSVMAAVAAILLTFGVFTFGYGATDVFEAVPEFTMFLYLMTCFGIVFFIATLVQNKKRF